MCFWWVYKESQKPLDKVRKSVEPVVTEYFDTLANDRKRNKVLEEELLVLLSKYPTVCLSIMVECLDYLCNIHAKNVEPGFTYVYGEKIHQLLSCRMSKTLMNNVLEAAVKIFTSDSNLAKKVLKYFTCNTNTAVKVICLVVCNISYDASIETWTTLKNMMDFSWKREINIYPDVQLAINDLQNKIDLMVSNQVDDSVVSIAVHILLFLATRSFESCMSDETKKYLEKYNLKC
jgi:hypothetical protein